MVFSWSWYRVAQHAMFLPAVLASHVGNSSGSDDSISGSASLLMAQEGGGE